MDKIVVRQALRVFQKILERGEPVTNGMVLDGMTASGDADGYNVRISDGKTTLQIMFHNAFKLDARNRLEQEAFFDHLEKIDRL